MQPVLVVGESVMDVIVTHDGVKAEKPGGSPLNVAVALSRLGAPVDFATALGDDTYGGRIAAHLAGSGVNVSSAPSARTAHAIATLRRDGSTQYEFDITWNIAGVEPPIPKIIHVGSLGMFLEPGAAQVNALLERRADAAVISLDPNVRPSLLLGPKLVRRRFEEVCASAQLVKLSREDAEWMYAGLPIRDLVERLVDIGPELVCVTDGANGALLTSREHSVHVPSMPCKVVDTIGAGDAYMAGLLFQIASVRQLPEAVRGGRLLESDLQAMGRFASRVASLTVASRGANPPWAFELTHA